MPTVVRGTSKTSDIHAQIRAGVLSGAYPTGSPLRLAELSARFGVSMSVIREALIRLAEQHLVTLTPNQGFRVAAISREDLIDLTGLRVLLEGRALRLSIERASVEWEALVVSTHYKLARLPLPLLTANGEAAAEWSAAHMEFHDALGSGCGSPRLIAITHMLRDGAELYRQLSTTPATPVRRDVAAEHRELMELATARQADEAVRALDRHLSTTATIVLETVLAEPISG